MNEEKQKILKKLLEDKEKLVCIKIKHNKEYKTIKEKQTRNIKNK